MIPQIETHRKSTATVRDLNTSLLVINRSAPRKERYDRLGTTKSTLLVQ